MILKVKVNLKIEVWRERRFLHNLISIFPDLVIKLRTKMKLVNEWQSSMFTNLTKSPA